MEPLVKGGGNDDNGDDLEGHLVRTKLLTRKQILRFLERQREAYKLAADKEWDAMGHTNKFERLNWTSEYLAQHAEELSAEFNGII